MLLTLLKYRDTLVFLVLLFISAVFVSNRSYYHQTKLSKLGTLLSGSVHHLSNNLLTYLKLKEQNALLAEENLMLKTSQLTEYHQWSNSLTDKTENSFPFKVYAARVLHNEHNMARNYMILNRGSSSNIRPEMGVISANGIVGIIDQVTQNYSSVLSLLHLDMRLSTRFKNSAAFGSLRWSGKHPSKMDLNDVTAVAQISIGDTVITAGFSAYFPAGIPVGTVSKATLVNSEGYYDIEVELFQSPALSDYVFIVENKNFEEVQQLINKD